MFHHQNLGTNNLPLIDDDNTSILHPSILQSTWIKNARIFTNPHKVFQHLHTLQTITNMFHHQDLGTNNISPFFTMTIPPSFIHPIFNQHGLESVDIFVNPYEALQCLHTFQFIDRLQAPSPV